VDAPLGDAVGDLTHHSVWNQTETKWLWEPRADLQRVIDMGMGAVGTEDRSAGEKPLSR